MSTGQSGGYAVGWRAIRGLLGTMALACTLASCTELLDVESPTRVPEDLLEDPVNASLLVASAVSDFECAFGEYIVAAGHGGDEFADAQLAALRFDLDRRTVTDQSAYALFDCSTVNQGIYTTLGTARFSADNAARLLEGFSDQDVPDRNAKLATAYTYGGYSRLLLGEAMCSAASLVLNADGEFEAGPEVTSQELFALAEDRFTKAIELGIGEVWNMALLGRARARLNRGAGANALVDAQQVPAGFLKVAAFSGASARSENDIFDWNIRALAATVEEDFRNLTFLGIPDPRVTAIDQGEVGTDGFTPWWTQTKYLEPDSPIPIARYEEAQLIIAEVQLGQPAVDIINALHQAAGLPNFVPSDVNDDIEILGHVIEERRRELFLESHHFHDKLRFTATAEALGITPAQLNPSLPATPAVGEPFSKGGFYGEFECLPLPFIEESTNPNI